MATCLGSTSIAFTGSTLTHHHWGDTTPVKDEEYLFVIFDLLIGVPYLLPPSGNVGHDLQHECSPG